ncbi:hypothetical protein [Flexivirga caeni]|uniref:DUF3592 domain-containing protein n=1 Tax=Flexivirga caeni TaxID=2294115 RepID=A0A3M9MEB6_9MICO|nr:hypothetical protein [Flexivirga caeni]RNI23910.1 hypothetical protein EFY87_06490 [Flexivirga caeni]
MPRTSPARPRIQLTRSQQIAALVAVVLIAYLASQWWHGRQPSGPARPAMTTGTVVKLGPAKDGVAELTVRYRVGSDIREVTKPVDLAAFDAQGKVAWVCYRPGDAGNAAIRLPEDELCGQR